VRVQQKAIVPVVQYAYYTVIRGTTIQNVRTLNFGLDSLNMAPLVTENKSDKRRNTEKQLLNKYSNPVNAAEFVKNLFIIVKYLSSIY
jgi:hypothetical protein